MTCDHCNDTGSLSKDIGGFIDCPYCTAAHDRTELEHWYRTEAKSQQHDLMDLIWLAIQRDRKIQQGEQK